MRPTFKQLNANWNAFPNGSESFVSVEGACLRFRFELNPYVFDHIGDGDFGVLTFRNCSRYRLGSPNDEGFYLGQCRFSKLCPLWGEFYEVTADQELLDQPNDWVAMPGRGNRHFLFYMKDDTFECTASDWNFEYEGNEQ